MKFDRFDNQLLYLSFAQNALEQARRATDPHARRAWEAAASQWQHLSGLLREKCFCGREALGIGLNQEGARVPYCHKHLRQALGVTGITLSPREFSRTALPVGSAIQVPCLLKSGFAVVIHGGEYVCLLMAGDMVHPFFCTPPLSVETLTPVELVAVSLEQADGHAHLSMVALARHAARNAGMPSLQRVADLLLAIAERQMIPSEGEIPVELPLTQDVMARLLAMSTVHFNRTMQKLRRTGVVEIRGHQRVMFDQARLEELALR